MSSLGPDEWQYERHACAWLAHGRSGVQIEAAYYLDGSRGERDRPSPIRWGWWAALVVSKHAALFFAFVAAGLTLAWSPLLVHLARRRLQDTAVAAVTIAAIIAARAHGDWSLALAFAALLALKPEGAALAVPAIAWAWGAVPGPSAPIIAGGLVWAAVTAWIFRGYAWPLVRAIAQKHEHDYGLTHQRGMWHRLPVDLAIVSPVWVGAALWFHPAELVPAALLVAAHALTPVRNVRTVLAADLLLRAGLYGVAPWPVLVAGVASDVWLVLRARHGQWYDTPTDELVRAIFHPPARP